MAAGPLRVVEHHAMVLKKFWRGSVVFSVVSPIMFLAAMGLGVGTLVGQHHNAAALGGVRYVDFVGPGLLAASVMQVAAGDSMWPIMGGIKWQKTWHAMLATPLSVDDLVIGQFTYTALRLSIGGLGYMLSLLAFGVVHSAWAVFALPAAVLCGMAFAAPIAAFTATQQTDQGFIVLFRIVVMPLFLFSGAFFPLNRLPGAFQVIAKVMPLWHGVDLVRGLVLGTGTWDRAAVHIAYLLLWLGTGWFVARLTFHRRLVT